MSTYTDQNGLVTLNSFHPVAEMSKSAEHLEPFAALLREVAA